MDLTEDGSRLKMMPVVDEYTREWLSIDVGCSITAEDVVDTLASVFRSRGEPPSSVQTTAPDSSPKHHRPHGALGYQTLVECAAAADLDKKVEDTYKPEELES
jgi:hypothetical protein